MLHWNKNDMFLYQLITRHISSLSLNCRLLIDFRNQHKLIARTLKVHESICVFLQFVTISLYISLTIAAFLICASSSRINTPRQFAIDYISEKSVKVLTNIIQPLTLQLGINNESFSRQVTNQVLQYTEANIFCSLTRWAIDKRTAYAR